jgi:arylsulfatase A-like enzyme
LRGSKLSLYEGGIREPLIAWWPGRVPAGRVDTNSVLSAIDFHPTLARVAGARPAADARPDGEEMSRALFGQEFTREKPLFWEYGRNTNSFAYPGNLQNRSPNVAMREGNWKLLVNADGSGAELFDLARDPNETRNISATRTEVAERLVAAALGWRRSLPPAPEGRGLETGSGGK